MKADVKAKWVTALRDGSYKQAHGRLKRSNGEGTFCCLGVLCDLHAKEVGDRWNLSTSYGAGKVEDYFGAIAALPREVKLWAGLEVNDPSVNTTYGSLLLSTLNDGTSPEETNRQAWTFDEIANVIEEQL